MKGFLSIVWYRVLPPVYGGQKGIAHFNDHLAKKVNLTCLCSQNNEAPAGLSYKLLNELPTSRFQAWNPLVRRQVLRLIKQHSFSHIIIEHPYYGWLGKHKSKYGFRFIVHAHNIEYLRMKARGKAWWRWIKRTERRAFASADHILFKTEEDKNKAISIFNIDASKCMIVPYGIEENEQPQSSALAKQRVKEKYGIGDDEKILFFAGTPDYEPNAMAVENILQEVIPGLQKRNFRFRVLIGGAQEPGKVKAINAVPNAIATGFITSFEEYLQAADVFINPVLTGSGIQTKNIDAIANGCNVVATQFAAAGLPGYLFNEKLFVTSDGDWAGFTNAIVEAAGANNPVPSQFYADYNWDCIVEKLLEEF
jgi:glycosyltransferase involved in cell wall biosynthesis